MITIEKRTDGKAMITKRASGYAVSAWRKTWNATGRTFAYGWETVASGLMLNQAEALLAAVEA